MPARREVRGACFGPALDNLERRCFRPLWQKYVRSLRLGTIGPEDILHSFVVSDGVHAVLRACLATVGLSLVLWRLVVADPGPFFRYFTNLSFTLLAIYYLGVALLTFHVWHTFDTYREGSYWRLCCFPLHALDPHTPERHAHRTKILESSSAKAGAIRERRSANATHCERLATFLWILFEIVSTNAVFLSIVFWVLLYNPESPPSAWDLIAHLSNAILILVELAFNTFPFVWSHFSFLIFLDLAYLVFAFIYHALTDEWIYFFLDISRPLAAVFYPSLILFGFIVFSGLLGLTRLRNHFAQRRHQKSNVQMLIDDYADSETFSSSDDDLEMEEDRSE